MHSAYEPGQRHAILTCYDDRIDGIVDGEIARIRAQGGDIRPKDIIRPPGGVHLFTGHSDCRKAFYTLLTSCSDITNPAVFHFWPHTNCLHCGKYHAEKIGSGAHSDLRFHLTSAVKMLEGAMDHFSRSSRKMPELDVRVILTIDQRIVTIDEARDLLPDVPEHSHHGAPCIHLPSEGHPPPQSYHHPGGQQPTV